MTDKEMAQIMAIIQVAFPAYYRNQSDADARAAVKVWADMFADESAEVVAAAVKQYIAVTKEGYPPTIGAIKEAIQKVREPDRMTVDDAWALAEKAAAGNLRWDKLPPMVQKAIGSERQLREWGLMDSGTFHSVVYSQFRKAYDTYDRRDREMAAVPSSVRNILTAVTRPMLEEKE